MQLIGKSLETAARVPGDHAARSDMLLGACLAGMAVSHTSTALIHGMSRPIGAAFHVPHGMSNAMLMPLVTEWSAVSAPKAYGRAAKAMGLAEDPAALIDALKSLNARLEATKSSVTRDFTGNLQSRHPRNGASGTRFWHTRQQSPPSR